MTFAFGTWTRCSFLLLAGSLTGCAGLETSKLAYNDSVKVGEPIKTEGCYDAAILLGRDLDQSKEIAKKVLAAVDSSISEDSAEQIKAQRNRHIGVIVGSGGEEITITLKTVAPGRTYVAVATKTGFVGAAGQKAWSCQIVDEIAKMVSH